MKCLKTKNPENQTIFRVLLLDAEHLAENEGFACPVFRETPGGVTLNSFQDCRIRFCEALLREFKS